MSRWLNSVNNLFDKLDGQLESAQGLLDDDPLFMSEVSGQSSVDDILAKRGELLLQNDDNEDEDIEEQSSVSRSMTTAEEEDEEEDEEEIILMEEEESSKLNVPPQEAFVQPVLPTTNDDEDEKEKETTTMTPAPVSLGVTEETDDTADPPSSPKKSTTAMMMSNHSTNNNSVKSQKEEGKNDEVRKLRRMVVKLNGQLELMEREMEAQRDELDRAADRLQSDHLKYKQKTEALEKRFAEELDYCQKQHEASQETLKNEYETQVSSLKTVFTQAEQTYQEQGGTLTHDLEQANQLQLELLQQMNKVQEEKVNFQTKAERLQTQVDTLTKQCQSWKEAQDIAIDREQQIQMQLDQTLSLHARQLSQKQARESQLERTIADLNAAYATVAAAAAQTQKQLHQKQQTASNQTTTQQEFQIQELQQELQELQKEHTMEQGKCETLLQEISTLQTQHTQEITQYQSQILQLQQKQLQTPSKAIKISTPSHHTNNNNINNNEQMQRVQSQLLKEKQAKEYLKGEISTLQKRLRSALQRASAAETSLQEQETQLAFRSPRSNNARNVSKKVPSIKMALKWDGGRGELQEWLGPMVDVLDTWSVEMGGFLKHQPLARLAFLCYLGILHLYTCFVLFFHFQSIELVSSDTTGTEAHGPHVAFQHSYRHMEQIHGPP